MADILLRHVGDDGTLFPYISADDDGGLIAEWVVGEQRIEIGVARDGSFYLIILSDGKIEINVDHASAEGAEVDLATVRKLLNILTRKVNVQNPDWRRIFSAK
ncbi:hypothetical protein [Amycolatopsis sp. NPDC003861]